MVQVNEEVKLVVFMEPQEKVEFERRGTYSCKPESTAQRIKEFCERTRLLPYSVSFVSIAVLRLDEDPCKSGACVYGLEDKPSISSIPYAVLKQTQELLAYVELVGDDDIKQILTLIAKRWENNEDFTSVTRRVKDLRPLLAEQKPSEMLNWTYCRGQHNYSEARLNRRLGWDEVEQWGICDNPIGGDAEGRNPGDEIADYFK